MNRQVAYVGIHIGKSNLSNDSNFGIPVFIDSDHLNNGPYKLQAVPALPPDSIKNIRILSHFNTRSLPIIIDSLTPYRATLSKNIPETAFLEIDKAYFPGYLAKVNNILETPLESPNGSILIPIRSQKMHDTITMEFVGTPSFRASYYISAASWLMVMFLIIYLKLLSYFSLWKKIGFLISKFYL
jgi:hypothetical protein